MLKMIKGVKMKDFSTFQIGGEVEGFFRIKKISDLEGFLTLVKKSRKEVLFLGGGSNLLFRDEPWPGWVAKLENEQIERRGNELVCGAGASLSRLVNFSKKQGLSGLEWAAGIPGTVGGAIRGNAGAFGGEMKDCLKQVIFFNSTQKPLKEKTFSVTECCFGYRRSLFKDNKRLLIWEAVVRLWPGEKDEIDEKMKKFLSQRKANQPGLAEFPSAGSIFKNPMGNAKVTAMFEKEKGVAAKEGKVPAGWLIEKVGLKGMILGGAQISHQQANFIVNLNQASAQEVRQLISLTKQKVKEKFGIELEEEIEILK